MASKKVQVLDLEAFASLADAPEGRAGTQKKIQWDNVLESIQAQPMTNGAIYAMIIADKPKYMFDENADNPNKGTIWTKLKSWIESKPPILRKAVDAQGNVFYGPART